MPGLAAALCVLSLASARALAAYTLVKEYSGTNFFSGWDFLDGYDNTTNGAVNWLNESAATAAQLAYINSDGHAVVRVDDTTNLPNVTVVTDQLKRNSVTLISSDYFELGSVFLFDAVHLPWGCSVWPAFWTRGTNWPAGGEIDILESVNLRTYNEMAVHTLPGCTQPAGVLQSGVTDRADCSAGPNSSWGCTVHETQANSFGDGFNDAGGGVWATQFDVAGVFIWFWSRPNVPDSVTSATTSIDTSTWGTPSASWPASSCNSSFADFWSAQQLILDITLCGDFAGEPNTYSQTCGQPGVTADANTCYIQNVNGTGTNYADAYFEINYVKVFSVDNVTLSASVSGTSTTVYPESASAVASPTAAASGTDGASGTGTGADSAASQTADSGASTGGTNGAARGARVAGAGVALTAVGVAVGWLVI